MQVAPPAAPLDAKSFAAAMARLGPFERAPAVVVAVSGGPDSLALALLAKPWVEARGGTLVALTVDHRLRAESAAEARQVERWLEARGISHHILVWRAAKPASGLQAAARAARYDLLAGWCRARGILHLLTGHQREDQAETVLMRLERGSGLDGLAAMPKLSERDGVRLLRPLLAVPRARLVALLEAAGQRFVEDPSNLDPAFGRVRLRATLAELEAHGLGAAVLAGLAHRLGAARAALDAARARLLARAVRLEPEGYASLSADALETAPDELVAAVFAALVTTVGGAVYPPAPEALARLVEAWRSGRLGRGRTLGGCRIVARPGGFLVCREPKACDPPCPIGANGMIRWDGRFAVRVNGRGGPAVASSSLGALGCDGVVALRRAGRGERIAEVPGAARPTMPALRGLDEQLTVPHLDFQGRGSKAHAEADRRTVAFRPRRSLAEAPFSAAPPPARVALSREDGV